MAKDVLYFSHDSNASRDPKMIAMRGVYGAQGYGWFWMLVEMMREADGYKLEMRSKYAFNAYAMQLQCECNAIASFVHDCINEFNLFSSDGEYFWSETLLRRMEKMHEKSRKAAESANARWGKKKKNASASTNHANASKRDAIKESKRNEMESKVLELINLNSVVYEKDDQIVFVNSYIGNMDFEVIEDAIVRANGKHINYVLKTLGSRLREGKTTKESIRNNVLPHPAMSASEREAQRQQELAKKREEEGPADHEYYASLQWEVQ